LSENIATPDVKTFDLGAILAGRGYPEVTVDIYLDEKAGLAIAETNAELSRLSGLGMSKEYTVLEKKFNGMLEELSARKLSVTVRGIPRKVKNDIVKKITIEFPSKKDAFGREDFSREADNKLTALLWQAHVVQVVSADGVSLTPSEKDIEDLLDLAPTADIRTIDAAIGKVESAGEGFDAVARGSDFLSKP
jgi:hypothetical protein